MSHKNSGTQSPQTCEQVPWWITPSQAFPSCVLRVLTRRPFVFACCLVGFVGQGVNLELQAYQAST